MALQYKKHTFGKMGDTQVTIVEDGLTKERLEFLKEILEYNKFTVMVEEVASKEEGGSSTFKLGVTDLLFNPVIWIYDRRLWTKDRRLVTHEYWDQASTETKPQYWEYRYENMQK